MGRSFRHSAERPTAFGPVPLRKQRLGTGLVTERGKQMDEVIFVVEEAPEGGYTASSGIKSPVKPAATCGSPRWNMVSTTLRSLNTIHFGLELWLVSWTMWLAT